MPEGFADRVSSTNNPDFLKMRSGRDVLGGAGEEEAEGVVVPAAREEAWNSALAGGGCCACTVKALTSPMSTSHFIRLKETYLRADARQESTPVLNSVHPSVAGRSGGRAELPLRRDSWRRGTAALPPTTSGCTVLNSILDVERSVFAEPTFGSASGAGHVE